MKVRVTFVLQFFGLYYRWFKTQFSRFPPNNAALAVAQQLANYLGKNLVITSGYRPESKGAHGELGGNAFDLGHNSNQPRISRNEMKEAYSYVLNVSSSMAIEETGCYHIQLQPGRGGATGFLPGLRDRNGNMINR